MPRFPCGYMELKNQIASGSGSSSSSRLRFVCAYAIVVPTSPAKEITQREIQSPILLLSPVCGLVICCVQPPPPLPVPLSLLHDFITKRST